MMPGQTGSLGKRRAFSSKTRGPRKGYVNQASSREKKRTGRSPKKGEKAANSKHVPTKILMNFKT